MTTATDVNVTPLEPFGAEIGADARTIDPQTLKDLFAEYGLLIFRDQSLTMDEQKRVVGALGPVAEHWSTVGYVSNKREGGILGSSNVCFHSDYAYTPQPTMAISLHGITCQYEATTTSFANAVAALEKLPPELRERAERHEGINLFAASEETLAAGQTLDGYPDDYPQQIHPLVRADEFTGEKALYTTQMYCAAVVGMDPGESDALLSELRAYLYEPSNVYTHRWREGDFVIWSNQRIHHARSAIDPDHERTLQRACVTTADPQVYEDAIPESIKLERVKRAAKSS